MSDNKLRKKLRMTPSRDAILTKLANGGMINHFSGFGNRMSTRSWFAGESLMTNEINKNDFSFLLKNHLLTNCRVDEPAPLTYYYKLSNVGRTLIDAGLL